MLVVALLGVAVASGLVALVEYAHYRVARVPAPADPTLRTAVVVLGYPSTRKGGLHPLQRWRVQIAARTASELADSWLIFSGAATRGRHESEATVMARHATADLGVAAQRVETEERARSTWENVTYAIPLALAGGAEQIAIASDPLHADKARRYVALQFPDAARQLVRAADYRPLERWWFKAPALAYWLMLRARGNYGMPPPDFAGPAG